MLQTHRDILNRFKQMFPNMLVYRWWRKKGNTIRIRAKGWGTNLDLIFTYDGTSEWTLETAKVYDQKQEVKG